MPLSDADAPAPRPRRVARGAVRRAGVAAAAIAVALAAGCASPPTMTGDVTRFHAWQADAPMSFAFRPTPEQAGSLEHRSYEAQVRAQLLALGFTEAAPGAARYHVAFDYRAEPEPRRIAESYAPGFGFSTWYGPRGPYPYWRYDPWWGYPPVPLVQDVTVQRHTLRLDLFDVRVEPPPGRKVYEARASADAPVESMPRLMPGLVAAALADFPGDSGTTRRVRVPLPEPAGR